MKIISKNKNRPFVENEFLRKQTAFREANRLKGKIKNNIKNVAIIYDNKVSPPSYGDFIIVVIFARYFVARGINVSFFIINEEYRDDWKYINEKNKIELFVNEQYKIATLLLNCNKAETKLVTWNEFMKKHANKFKKDQIIPHEKKVLNREPIYNYCFNLISYLLDNTPSSVQINTLVKYEELLPTIDKQITVPYITWHCRYSTKWALHRNLSEIDFIKIYGFLKSRFLGYKILIVSDDIGCNYFSCIAQKHGIDLLYSKNYSGTFLGDSGLVLGSKFYFAFNGGGVSVFPTFSKISLLLIAGGVHETFWKPGQYVQWQTPQQVYIRDTVLLPKYLKVIDAIIKEKIKDPGEDYMTSIELTQSNKSKPVTKQLKQPINILTLGVKSLFTNQSYSWKFKHFMTICESEIGNQPEAIKLWDRVIKECNDSYKPFHDYAKYLTTIGRNTEALKILLKGLKSASETLKLWELGCTIIKNDEQLQNIFINWTNEAAENHPNSYLIKESRQLAVKRKLY